MKLEYGQILNQLENQLSTISEGKQNIEGLLKTGIDKLLNLNYSYISTNLSEARDLIGLIYPENFTFRNNHFQTARVNEIVGRIYMINKELAGKKKRDKRRFFFFVP